MELEKLMDLLPGQVVVLRLGQSVVLWLGKAMNFLLCYAMLEARSSSGFMVELGWQFCGCVKRWSLLCLGLIR